MEKKATDPRVLRTRQLIRDAFIELLEEMDVEKISVNRIAERATINRVTFYLHYRDIPDMMERMADEMIEEFEAILRTPPAVPASAEADWPMLVRLLEHIAGQAKFYKLVLASKRTPVFTDRLLKLLGQLVADKIESGGRAASLEKAGIQKEIAIWYGSSALIGTIVSWLRKDIPYTPQFLAGQFTLLRKHARQFDRL
ncbi:TetR/AcrR family transcriptional regulator C-terminal domain-containing protein [Paenibacillus sp. MWE-103]|uniref:TetR/AcrR family transcriptional regulator C-terminal domain-containing protein n=1 Tax=Paenibacillus artemisiicola TaxID=1172618 RepID=A0ABS3WAN2_9BACL|nr:TetR-like C-terminal domain-containing protein [Paenibacillus artemisiicola]MBO7745347.1 TetR/AcrR family transcriptional regulator C-terminal domain-containing protein [Paenibacillus artemisiicola]